MNLKVGDDIKTERHPYHNSPVLDYFNEHSVLDKLIGTLFAVFMFVVPGLGGAFLAFIVMDICESKTGWLPVVMTISAWLVLPLAHFGGMICLYEAVF